MNEKVRTQLQSDPRRWQPNQNSAKPPVALGHGQMPWVVVQNRERYPCFLDDYEACLETYADLV